MRERFALEPFDSLIGDAAAGRVGQLPDARRSGDVERPVAPHRPLGKHHVIGKHAALVESPVPLRVFQPHDPMRRMLDLLLDILVRARESATYNRPCSSKSAVIGRGTRSDEAAISISNPTGNVNDWPLSTHDVRARRLIGSSRISPRQMAKCQGADNDKKSPKMESPRSHADIVMRVTAKRHRPRQMRHVAASLRDARCESQRDSSTWPRLLAQQIAQPSERANPELLDALHRPAHLFGDLREGQALDMPPQHDLAIVRG